MADFTTKLASIARADLEPGESLLAAVRGMSKGATKGIVGGAAGAVTAGALGGVIGGRAGQADRDAGDEQARAAGIPELPAQITLALTDRRLLVFRRSALSGKTKDLVAEIPRDRIVGIDGEYQGKLSPHRLTVGLIDGTLLDFEVVRIDGYQKLADAFG